DRGCDEFCHIGLDPGVDFERDRLAAGFLHSLRGVVHARRPVANDQLCALGGKAQRARAADAGARSGDDRDLAVQCAHAHPPLEVLPPSMTIVWPVVKPPAGLARNTAAPAISWGSPM